MAVFLVVHFFSQTLKVLCAPLHVVQLLGKVLILLKIKLDLLWLVFGNDIGSVALFLLLRTFELAFRAIYGVIPLEVE